jgi:hypothetical protein
MFRAGSLAVRQQARVPLHGSRLLVDVNDGKTRGLELESWSTTMMSSNHLNLRRIDHTALAWHFPQRNCCRPAASESSNWHTTLFWVGARGAVKKSELFCSGSTRSRLQIQAAAASPHFAGAATSSPGTTNSRVLWTQTRTGTGRGMGKGELNLTEKCQPGFPSEVSYNGGVE